MTKYGPLAQQKVEKAMHEMKEGNLTNGQTGTKVINHDQAVVIGLSEARKKAGKDLYGED